MAEKSINQRIVELHNEGLTVSEIAKRLGVRYQRVRNTLIMKGIEPRKSGRAHTGEKKQKIIELLEQGKSVMEICWITRSYPNYVYFVKRQWEKSEK